MKLVSVAWKNIGRNRKRSLIVFTAVLLGVTSGVFTCGLIIGWSNQRIDSVINFEESHIKAYNPDFLNNDDIDKIVPNYSTLISFLNHQEEVKCTANRIKITAMATTSNGTTSLTLNGVDPSVEKSISTLYTQVIPNAGTYLGEDDANAIFISDKTAEQLRIKSYNLDERGIDSLDAMGLPENLLAKLAPFTNVRFNTKKLFEKEMRKVMSQKEITNYAKVLTEVALRYRIRSKILFTFTDKNGELINQTFRVCGVYKTSNTMFDQMNAFVPQNVLAKLADLKEGEYHEVAILLKKNEDLSVLQNKLRDQFQNVSFLNWKELVPDAGMMEEYMALFNYIILGFILFALAFGIINTMMMAILERTKELGMLMAIGMNKTRVFGMIMFETIFLTLTGAVGGMILGGLIILVTGHTGLDFSSVGEGFEAMGWSAVVYPTITLDYFFGITLLVILTGILASIAPARKALSLNPVEALKSDN